MDTGGACGLIEGLAVMGTGGACGLIEGLAVTEFRPRPLGAPLAPLLD